MKRIDCFIPMRTLSQVEKTVSALSGEETVSKIFLLREEGAEEGELPGV